MPPSRLVLVLIVLICSVSLPLRQMDQQRKAVEEPLPAVFQSMALPEPQAREAMITASCA